MIPASALISALAIVGRTGSGKTFAAKSAVERLLADGARVCVIDPTGAWYGLRSRPDGSPSVFAPVIFGGDHADVPIDEGAGARLGALIASGRVRASIVDVSDFTGGQTTRLLTDLCEELYRANRAPLHLVMDEADVMAPQQPLPEQQRLKGAVNKLVRRGRIKGVRPMMITQRPAVIDKSVLSQIATLVVMRLTAPQDRKAVEDWVKGNADGGRAREVLDALPSLAVGEGFVWSPAEDMLERVQFPPIATFDSSRAPEEGDAIAQPGTLPAADLAELREALSTAEPARTRSYGPRKPHPSPSTEKNVTEVLDDGRASAAFTHTETGRIGFDEPTLEQIEKRVLAAYERGLAEGRAQGFQAGKDELATLIMTAAAALAQPKWEDRERTPSTIAAPPVSRAALPEKLPRGERLSKIVAAAEVNSAGRKILAVLDTSPPVRRTWRQAAQLAGIKATGGHFNAGRKALREGGLILEEGDLIQIAKPSPGAPAAISDPAALVEVWAGVLKGSAPKLLRALLAAGGRARRADIAAHLGIAPTGGHWNTGWKELRDNEIVTVSGDVAELSALFRT